jgi:chromate transport protein ChrA
MVQRHAHSGKLNGLSRPHPLHTIPGEDLQRAFAGYVVAATTGAIVARVAIFLPSFLFVLVLNPFIPRLRSSQSMSAFLDPVNASSIGLMAAVVIQFARAAVVGWRATDRLARPAAKGRVE